MTALGGWESLYVIVGSSAGALIGLQFVVMALVSDVLPGWSWYPVRILARRHRHARYRA